MSFLNPVNEPVRSYFSSDDGAPQSEKIPGSVKTILKACAVTGYGNKQGAGWTIEEDTDSYSADFIAPSANMSDYKLILNDSDATKTQWGYIHLNERKTRNQNIFNKFDGSSGWAVFVTERGLWYIATEKSSSGAKLSQMIYFGQVKSGLFEDMNKNIACFGVGNGAQDWDSRVWGNIDALWFGKVGGIQPRISGGVTSATPYRGVEVNTVLAVEDTLYLSYKGNYVAQIPGLRTIANGVINDKDIHLEWHNPDFINSHGRACSSFAVGDVYDAQYFGVVQALIAQDYWEY